MVRAGLSAWFSVVLLLFLAGSVAWSQPPAEDAEATYARRPEKRASDATIARWIIQKSIEDYAGNCPCPYNVASNGTSCRKRSAYSRQGGEAPLCYARDVTADMIAEYRALNGYAPEVQDRKERRAKNK